MAAPKRSTAEREADLVEMARMLAEGATERELADRFDLAVSTVHRDVVEIEKRWRETAAKTIDTWKAKLLAGHEHTVAEAYREWHRSKEDAQKIVELTELVEDPAVIDDDDRAIANDEAVRPKVMSLTERTVTTEASIGDPRLLTVVTNARAEQAKIVGAYAPVKQEMGGRDGAAIPVQIIEIIPPDPPSPETEP